MGVVYRGRSRSGRDVAVKVVHAQYAQDKVFRARFRQEIESVRKVSGAFTAPVVDADPEAIRPWMATQYVPGSTLAERNRDHGAFKGRPGPASRARAGPRTTPAPAPSTWPAPAAGSPPWTSARARSYGRRARMPTSSRAAT